MDASDGDTNRLKLKQIKHTFKADSRNLDCFAFSICLAIAVFTSVFMSVSVASSSETEFYTQTMYRPEERGDRPHGLFHESRLRYSFGTELKLELGSYFLAEWNEKSATSSASTNMAISPYVGARWRKVWSAISRSVSLTLQFEGRHREPLSEFSRSIDTAGWDPRTGAVFGVWQQFDLTFLNGRPFGDLYTDLFFAPKYGSTLMSTFIGRLGNRYVLTGDHLAASTGEMWTSFADYYLEAFRQNATGLELGSRREEARAGLAIGGWNSSGSVQLRIFHGWPMSSAAGTDDVRSRTEGLLVGGYSL